MKKLGIALASLLIVAISIGSISCSGEQIVYTATPTPTTTPTPQVWSDGIVGITVDKVERVNTLPQDIKELATYPVPTLAPSEDYIAVYLTVAHTYNNWLSNILGYEKEHATLYDAEGISHDCLYYSFSGVASVAPKNVDSGLYFPAGATACLIFDIDKHAEPARITIVYSFKKTLEEALQERGQIDIILNE